MPGVSHSACTCLLIHGTHIITLADSLTIRTMTSLQTRTHARTETCRGHKHWHSLHMAKCAVLGPSGCQTAWVVYSMSGGWVLKRDSGLLCIVAWFPLILCPSQLWVTLKHGVLFLVIPVLIGWRLWSHAPVSTCMWIWPLVNAAGIPLQAFLSARQTATNGGSSLITRVAAFTTTTHLSVAQSGIDPRGPISCPSHSSRPWGAVEISRGLEGPSTSTTLGPLGVSAAQGARASARLYLRRTVTYSPELSRPVKRTPSLSQIQQWTVDFTEKEAAQNMPQTTVKTLKGKPDGTFTSVCSRSRKGYMLNH